MQHRALLCVECHATSRAFELQGPKGADRDLFLSTPRLPRATALRKNAERQQPIRYRTDTQSPDSLLASRNR